MPKIIDNKKMKNEDYEFTSKKVLLYKWMCTCYVLVLPTI